MTIEYVVLLALAGLVLMPALLNAPKKGFYNGSVKLGARVETQIATGSGFKPYPGGGDNENVPWAKKE